MRRHTTDYVKKFLADRGIQLLSKKYKNSTTKLHVRFDCGCDGRITFNCIQKGERCGNCRKNARVTAEDYARLAASHGGKVVVMASTVGQPSEWRCKKRHPTFLRPYSTIQQSGTFCPDCSRGFSERLCRAAAEQLFGQPFKKKSFKAVRGFGSRYFEIDAYNDTLKLAIEHNGPQHFRPVRFGNQTQEQAVECFRKQQERDQKLRQFCKSQKITLIEIRELGRHTKIENLKDVIKAGCQAAGFRLPPRFDDVVLDLSVHNLKTTAEEMWERILKRVAELGYTLKSADYLGAHERLSLLCCNNHVYKPRVNPFLRGSTCRKCWLEQRRVPVVALFLGKRRSGKGQETARLFDSIERAAKAIGADPNNVRTIAKRRGKTCRGYGIAEVTPAQARLFIESPTRLREFCKARWPGA